MGYDEEDVAGRCAAILATRQRCPNASLPGSRYCGLPAAPGARGTDTDDVGHRRAVTRPPATARTRSTSCRAERRGGPGRAEVDDATVEEAELGRLVEEAAVEERR